MIYIITAIGIFNIFILCIATISILNEEINMYGVTTLFVLLFHYIYVTIYYYTTSTGGTL
jgi:hypothetical protein